ncbi:MAG: 4'-phosphopantetheinyl transferase superfamily protein [Thermogemmata sp.]|jgi:holo-[acyl-carrier protein] synthase|uniref:4'-phosphopantetheinyl transferase superfamily protein n=1 Tax=Thermogemmata fonticola TaxID=2755323 RepID=A0A7V9ABG2_9BACT|nr:4'-phosphopantetheinyl transferase superfamily protein [Thermogemmata fonticola]MBA2225742.1 4'-phosphopantetheinyl transferase superfamily protein [Thermogemmata fonticola]MCX8138920.1 4'-phosphopantetheinyl transferase superfamily protein [Gemmataceae bacterium]
MDIAGIGTQVLECVRVRELIDQHGELFLQQVFTDAEIAWCNGQKHTTEYFTALWAIKEAAFRAIGLVSRRTCRWKELAVQGSTIAALRLVAQGATREYMEHQGIAHLLVTAAYCRAFATATVLALRGSSPPAALHDTTVDL